MRKNREKRRESIVKKGGMDVGSRGGRNVPGEDAGKDIYTSCHILDFEFCVACVGIQKEL